MPRRAAAYEESIILFRTIGDKWRAAGPLGRLGDLDFRLGKNAEARRLYLESLALFREANDKSGIATSLNPLGAVALKEDDLDQAERILPGGSGDQSGIGRQAGHGVGVCRSRLLPYRQRDYDQAESMLQRALALLTDVGDDGGMAWVLQQKGYVNCARGNFRGAACCSPWRWRWRANWITW